VEQVRTSLHLSLVFSTPEDTTPAHRRIYQAVACSELQRSGADLLVLPIDNVNQSVALDLRLASQRIYPPSLYRRWFIRNQFETVFQAGGSWMFGR
jgi:hypothetical protein